MVTASAKITTLHPSQKQGVNIDKTKYEQMSSSIVYVLERDGALSFTTLAERVREELEGKFQGSIMWYYVTVKLDLEARGLIQRLHRNGVQVVDLNSGLK